MRGAKKIRPPLREIFEGREEESGRPKTRIVVAAEKEREEGLEIDRSPTAAARGSSEEGRRITFLSENEAALEKTTRTGVQFN